MLPDRLPTACQQDLQDAENAAAKLDGQKGWVSHLVSTCAPVLTHYNFNAALHGLRAWQNATLHAHCRLPSLLILMWCIFQARATALMK